MPYIVLKINGKATSLSKYLLTGDEIDNHASGDVKDCYIVQNTTSRRVFKVGKCGAKRRYRGNLDGARRRRRR